MAEWTLNGLKQHLGHEISLADYAGEVCIECIDCSEILLEFHEEDHPAGGILALGPEDEQAFENLPEDEGI